jgi:hypothetical protein
MDNLNDAVQLIRQGRREQAQHILEGLLKADPHNIQAWFWYVETWPALDKRIKTLEVCLKLNPGNLQVTKALDALRVKQAASAPAVPPPQPPAPAKDLELPDWAKPAQPKPLQAGSAAGTSVWAEPAQPQPVQSQAEYQSSGAFHFDENPVPVEASGSGWQHPRGESKPAFDWDALEQESAQKNGTAQTFVETPVQERHETEPKPGGRSYSFFDVWMTALTTQNVPAYATLLDDPEATPGRAFEWMAYVGAIIGLIFPVAFLINPQFKELMAMPEFRSLLGNLNPTVLLIVMGLAMAVFYAISSVLGLIINAALQNLMAHLFGGQGTFGRTAYAMGAYLAPLSLVSAIIGIIPIVNCLGAILGIYSIVLNVRALQAAHSMNTGRALAAILVPGLVFVVICCVLGLAFSSTFSTIFQSINNSLPSY